MRKLKLFRTALKTGGANKILISFIIYFLFTSLIVYLVDPAINNFFNSMWYCFTVISTIGFGDIVVTTVAAKILTVLLSFYALIVLAIITGTVVNYFSELQKAKSNESVLEFLDKLEHLDTLSKEELKEISKKVSKHKLAYQKNKK